ncbi:hypothetical protein Tco_0982222 [Tanacetum coccineum]
MRRKVTEILGVREVAHLSKYLGLPLVIGRSKKVVFQNILDKITKKLSGWKEKTLSICGKEVLLKSMAQAIPIYNVGNGSSINIWPDKWLLGCSLNKMRQTDTGCNQVQDLMVDSDDAWHVALIHRLFPPHISIRILDTYIAHHRDDRLFWIESTHGEFAVRDAYNVKMTNLGFDHNLSTLELNIC